jgi:hypothetical protein
MKINCDGSDCPKNCQICGVSVKQNENHRCFIYLPPCEEAVFWKQGDPVPAPEDKKGPFMLWSYDLESAIRRTEVISQIPNGPSLNFDTKDSEFIINDEGVYQTSYIARAAHEVNMVVFRNVFDDNSERILFGKDALKEFILEMTTTNGGRNIVVAHNGAGYDTRLVFETASLFYKDIKPLARGGKFLQLTVGKTIFRDSLLHLPGGLAKLAKDFLGAEANMRKGHFPHLFNSEENYSYVGQIPDKKYFDMTFFARDAASVNEFNKWYEIRKLEPWNFMHELTEYCRNDVAILAKLMKEYHDICVEKFKISPWFYTTAPAYVHTVVKKMISTDEFLQLPDKDDAERYKSRIQELAEEEHWGILKPNEYWFARLALRGGRTDVRQLYYNLTEEEKAKGYEIRYQDIVSMYPYVQVAHQYPVGLPEIHVYDEALYPCRKHQNPVRGNVLKLICDCNIDVKIRDRDCGINIVFSEKPTKEEILEDESFFGIVCASMEPPKNLYHPVLVTWDDDANKCVASLETINYGVFTTPEFKKALSVGYKLIQIHRFDKYHCKAGLWNDFIKELYIEKMANSESTPNEETQTMLVDAYEDRFGMGDAVLESFPRWAKNSAKRQVFKIMLNSGWGKHCQRAIMGQVLMVGEEDDDTIFDIFANSQANKIRVSDIVDVGNLKMFRFENVGSTTKPNLHDGYLPAGLFVPAYGRLQLYEYLEKLGKRVLYHDTDSIIYLYIPGQENIPSSSVWGGWDEEKISQGGSIQTFVSLGPKTYGIKTKNGETMIKAKGLSVKHSHRNILNFDTMVDFINNHLRNEYPTIQVPQFSFSYSAGKGMYTNYFLKKFSFQPEILKGKLHSDLRVYPNGFCRECMDNEKHCS